MNTVSATAHGIGVKQVQVYFPITLIRVSDGLIFLVIVISQQLIQYRQRHGLRTPNEAFFHRNPKLLGLGRQIGQINFGAFRVFSANLSAPILVL